MNNYSGTWIGSRQNMTLVETKRLEVNAQLTRWFVSFAEFSCNFYRSCVRGCNHSLSYRHDDDVIVRRYYDQSCLLVSWFVGSLLLL